MWIEGCLTRPNTAPIGELGGSGSGRGMVKGISRKAHSGASLVEGEGIKRCEGGASEGILFYG